MQLRLLVVVAVGVPLIACNPRPEQASTPMAQVTSPAPAISTTEAAPTPEPAPMRAPTSILMPEPPTGTPRATSYTLLVTNSAARHISFVEPTGGAIE